MPHPFRGANCDKHGTIATFTGELTQLMIDFNNSVRRRRLNCIDNFLIENMRVRIVTSWGFRFQPVTQVATCNKSYWFADSIHCTFDTTAESSVIVVRQKRITKGYNASLPTVFDQEIERHGYSVIQYTLTQPCDMEAFFSSFGGYPG